MARNKILQTPRIQSDEPYVQNILIEKTGSKTIQFSQTSENTTSTQNISIETKDNETLLVSTEVLDNQASQNVLITDNRKDIIILPTQEEGVKIPTPINNVSITPSFVTNLYIEKDTPQYNYQERSDEPSCRLIKQVDIVNKNCNLGVNTVENISIDIEKDPIFTSSPAYTISNEDIARWNSKIEIQFGNSSDDIKMNGVVSVGNIGAIPRIDHIHPVDTSRQSASSELSAIASVTGSSGLLKKIGTNRWSLDTTDYIASYTPIVAATKTKITYDSRGLITKGENVTALEISSIPSGNILSTNVQNALNELDQKKVSATVINSLSWTTAYDYDIIGQRDNANKIFTIPYRYYPGTPRVHLNGLRLQKGIEWDYNETLSNKIILNYPIGPNDLLLIDYIVQA